MEAIDGRICRLCFKMSRHNYEPIDEITREMLNVLLVKVNFSLSAVPIICGDCTESVRKFFEFKSTCLYTEDRLAPMAVANSGAKLDLMEIYLNENTNRVTNPDDVVCRFCMQCSAREQHVALDVLKGSFLKDTISRCIPEVDLTIVQEFMICTVCMEYLTNFFNFIKSCCDLEEKVKEYCSAENIIGQVDLNDVHQFVLGVSSDVITIKTEEVTIKNEIDVDDKPDDSDRLSEVQLLSHQNKSESLPTTNPSISKRSHKCDLCTYQAKRKDHLRLHMLTHKQPSQKKLYNCDLCQYECGREDYLKAHKKRHQSIGYPCKTCSFVSKSKDALQKHEYYNHSTELPKFQCAKCPYVTIRKSSIRHHVVTHMERWKTARFKCELCTFATTRKTILLNHQVLHKDTSELTTYKCDKCPYECKLKQYLKLHMTTHDTTPEAKRFKCNLCTYKAKMKKHLKAHMATHQSSSERKFYRCDWCEYKSVEKGTLKKHMLQKHKNEDVKRGFFKCYLCPLQTKEKNTLKHHIFNKHMKSKTTVPIF